MRYSVYPLIILYGVLTACSTTPVAVCPAIVPYSLEQQTKAAQELESLPRPSMLERFMQDYGELRARLRACK